MKIVQITARRKSEKMTSRLIVCWRFNTNGIICSSLMNFLLLWTEPEYLWSSFDRRRVGSARLNWSLAEAQFGLSEFAIFAYKLQLVVGRFNLFADCYS